MSHEIYVGQTSPPVVFTLTDDAGAPIDLTVPTVTLVARNEGGVVFSRQVAGDAAGVISYAWQTGDTDDAGVLRFEASLDYGGGVVVVVPIADTVEVRPRLANDTSVWYATDEGVRNALGNLRDRLPAWVELEAFRTIAHAQIVDRLAKVYPNGIPTFAGAGLLALRVAEAKLAAAEILEAVRVNLPDLGDAPDRLRESAFDAIGDGVVGYPAGTDTVDTPTVDGVPTSRGPRVSSFTPLSAFPDPYGLGRVDARFE